MTNRQTGTEKGLLGRVTRDFFVVAALMPLFGYGWLVAWSGSGQTWGFVAVAVVTLGGSALMTTLGTIILIIRWRRASERTLNVVMTLLAALPFPLAWMMLF